MGEETEILTADNTYSCGDVLKDFLETGELDDILEIREVDYEKKEKKD